MTAPALRALQSWRGHIRRFLGGAVVLLVVVGLASPVLSAPGRVLPGVDVLLLHYGDFLAGKRVAVITHQAAAGAGGWPTATLVSVYSRAQVVALLVPEHGFSGLLPAGAPVPNSADRIPIYSLYPSPRPSAEMLANIDALVFDLQDVGARAYTYISTMAIAMQAAAEANKLFVVLDRPNPLGGDRIDGPVLDPAFASFIGLYPLPSVHGMTVGELAWMFNREFKINAPLVVVPMSGWNPTMQWEDTGLAWIPPSPTITSPMAAQFHAATGLLEGTNLTIGAGTDTPYETVTAPWLQGDLLSVWLNERQLPGVRFEPIVVGVPGRRSGGVRLVLTDVRQFRPATTAVYLLEAIRQLSPDNLQFTAPTSGERCRFDLVWGTDTVRKAILRGDPADRIVARWNEDLLRFLEIRKRYLLYPRVVTPVLP